MDNLEFHWELQRGELGVTIWKQGSIVLQGIFRIEFWGGPLDGRIQEVLNPTETLKFPVSKKFELRKDSDPVPYDEIMYDFSYQLPTKTLLYKIRKEVRV